MGKCIGKLRLGFGVLVGLLAVGCGDGDDGSGVYAMRQVEDGKGGSGGLVEPDAGAPRDPAAPIVTLLEPLPAVDPNRDTVLTTGTVTARCRVTRSQDRRARDVDQSSVKMQLLGEGEDAIPVTAAVDAVSEEEFEAHFSLPDLPNGRLRFGCTANDLGTPPLLGWDDVDTFLDLGPSIEMLQPEDASIHALKAPVAITFKVAAAPVSADDNEADLDSLQIVVSGQEFEAVESEEQPGFYSALVDFGDRTLFPMVPSTAQIVVTATSHRMPVAGERRKVANIVLDSDGPSISVSSPANFTLVRGEVTLVLNVTDDSGVDTDSVVATINDGLFELSNWTVLGDTYSERFDTRIPETEDKTQLSINVTARDKVGNEETISHSLLLDNLPPLLSLDPPPVREWKASGTATLCSAPFDPLGDAVGDGALSLPPATLFRIAVTDQANQTPGSNIIHIAGVEPSRVQLFAQEPDKPLLVDTNDDGICDDVLQEGPNPPVVNDDFTPLPPSGAAYFAPMGPANPESPPGDCTYGTEIMPPAYLCRDFPSDMIRVIPQPYVSGKPPAIYAWGVLGGGGLGCTGDAWALGDIERFQQGWVCVVARAEDKIGNVGVSPPIRICYGSNCDLADIPDCLGTADEPCSSPPDWPSGQMLRQ